MLLGQHVYKKKKKKNLDLACELSSTERSNMTCVLLDKWTNVLEQWLHSIRVIRSLLSRRPLSRRADLDGRTRHSPARVPLAPPGATGAPLSREVDPAPHTQHLQGYLRPPLRILHFGGSQKWTLLPTGSTIVGAKKSLQFRRRQALSRSSNLRYEFICFFGQRFSELAGSEQELQSAMRIHTLFWAVLSELAAPRRCSECSE